MALVLADRVKETTTTTGTGDISLGGAETNFVAFGTALSDGDTTYYAIVDDVNADFEIGIGTYTSGTDTLSRDTILDSTNAGSAVNLSAGTKVVFITYPAGKSVRVGGNVSDLTNDAGYFAGFTSTVTATGVTASAGEHVHITASTQTITLPASPSAGERVAISVGDFTDTVVGRNSLNIMGLAEDFTIDVANMGLTFIYTDASNGWRLL
jgi:hypothetical protein